MSHHVSVTESKEGEFQRDMEQVDMNQNGGEHEASVHETSEYISEREKRKAERDRRREEHERKREELMKLQDEEERRALELQKGIEAREKELEALDQNTESSEDTSKENIEGFIETETEHVHEDDNFAIAQERRVNETTQFDGICLEARAAPGDRRSHAQVEEESSFEIPLGIGELQRTKVAIEARKRLHDLEIEKKRISLATQKALEEIDAEMMKSLQSAGNLGHISDDERKALETQIRFEEYQTQRKKEDERKRYAEAVMRQKAEKDRAIEQKRQRELEYETHCRHIQEQREKLQGEQKALEAQRKLQRKKLQEEQEALEAQRKLLLMQMKSKDSTLDKNVDLGLPIDSSTDIEDEREEEKDFKRRMSWLDERYEKLPEEEKVVFEGKPHRTEPKSRTVSRIKKEQFSGLEEKDNSRRWHVRQKVKPVRENLDDTMDEAERCLNEKIERLKKKDGELALRISKVKAKQEKDEQRKREKTLKEERIRKLKEMEQSLIESLREKESKLSELETSRDETKSQEKKEKTSSRQDENRKGISFKKPTIPKLTEETFEEWKQEVEVIMNSGLYHGDIIRQEVRNSLSGNTRKILLNMDPEASTKELITKLENIYGNIRTGESVLAEFYNAQQRDTETSAEWGVRIEGILNSAIKKGQVQKNKADEMLRNRFWRHLKSFHLKNATIVFYETEKDFEGLKRKVRIEENEMKAAKEKEKREKQGEKHVTSQQRTDSNEQMSMMKSLLDRMEKLEKEIKKQSEVNEQRKKDSDRHDQTTSEKYRSDDSQRGDYSNRGRSWNRGNYRRGYGFRRGYRGNYYSHPNSQEEDRHNDRRENSQDDRRRHDRREPRDVGSREDTHDFKKGVDTQDQKKGN